MLASKHIKDRGIYNVASPTLLALFGFIVWTLLLLLLMELVRTKLVIFKQAEPHQFDPQNSALSPFMQRLARSHANCIEGLPMFGGLLVVALISSRTAVTDPLAFTLLTARIVQSTIHILSTSQLAITLRFAAFAVQLVISIVWIIGLANVFLGQ